MNKNNITPNGDEINYCPQSKNRCINYKTKNTYSLPEKCISCRKSK